MLITNQPDPTILLIRVQVNDPALATVNFMRFHLSGSNGNWMDLSTRGNASQDKSARPHVTVAGVPAQIVGRPSHPSPALDMDQSLDSR